DALDLCYTKGHVDTFVVISGDSDFSPLVSKLRENNKTVIGVGVKSSTSDLLIANCDEFIFYDNLISKPKRKAKKKASKKKKKTAAKSADDKQQKAYELVLATTEDLFSERDAEEKVWGSMVKQALKRRKPGFSESYHGFKSFNHLLQEAEKAGLLELQHDEKSGGYIIKSFRSED
ncbi:MAG: NYN domain-containing protein, partial [Pseudomonadota bacterium]